MRGETVTIAWPHPQKPEDVDNVLVTFTTTETVDVTRMHAHALTATFYLPRSWQFQSLRGAHIEARGRMFRVLGDPQPPGSGMTPTAWGLEVQAECVEG